MKSKKITATVLGIALAFSAGALAACDNGGNGEDEQKDINFKVEQIPVLSFDTAEDSAINEVIATDELVVSFDSGNEVSAAVTSGSVTIAEGEATTSGSTVTQEYTLTATGAGDYTLTFTVGSETVQTLEYTVSLAYPEEPDLNEVSGSDFSNTNPSVWNIAKAHDPSVIEDEGKYYVFSTDNAGAYGYQVRESDDLINWSWVGNAIPNCGTSATNAEELYESGNGALQEVYDLISQDENWSTGGAGDNKGETWTLWAPDVVKGSDGKYWLYGCWTADFGQGHSIIFLCKADVVTGPYSYDSILLYSYDGWPMYDGGITSNPNAIDPQIYYVGDKMYMAYGSFNGGTWSIELDPETGRRADGLTKEDLVSSANTPASERYGTRLVNGTVIEGPTINYHENVAIYEGDPAEYSESAVEYVNRYYLMGSANKLSSDYNMRSFHADETENGVLTFSCTNTESGGNLGDRVSGSFSWQHGASKREPLNYSFSAPGHNDMLTTSDGRNVLVYHNRTGADGFDFTNHYLFVSTYAFNSRGDLVMNPNRYAGESVRKIVEQEIYTTSGGNYDYVLVNSNNYAALANGGYALDGFSLTQDHKISLDGEEIGTWLLYGDNYIYFDITSGDLTGKYYGVAMPAWIDRSDRGGLTISCLSEDGQDTLYLNMAW